MLSLFNQTNIHVPWIPCWKSQATWQSWQSTSLRSQNLNKENNKAHNSVHLTTCPNQPKNGFLIKNYSLSFRFFNLVSFLFMLPLLSRRSALSVTKDGARGGGTYTMCPLGPRITSTLSTVSATSGASGWTTGCPTEIPKQVVQAAADPRQPRGRPWQGLLVLPQPRDNHLGFPPQPSRKLLWRRGPPPQWRKHAELRAPWCLPLGLWLPPIGNPLMPWLGGGLGPRWWTPFYQFALFRHGSLLIVGFRL